MLLRRPPERRARRGSRGPSACTDRSATTPAASARTSPRCSRASDLVGALDDAGLRALRLEVAPDVTEERHHWPGAEQPTVILLRQGGGFGRAIDAGTGLAALVGAADGELPLGVLSDAIAELLGVDAAELWDELGGAPCASSWPVGCCVRRPDRPARTRHAGDRRGGRSPGSRR